MGGCARVRGDRKSYRKLPLESGTEMMFASPVIIEAGR